MAIQAKTLITEVISPEIWVKSKNPDQICQDFGAEIPAKTRINAEFWSHQNGRNSAQMAGADIANFGTQPWRENSVTKPQQESVIMSQTPSRRDQSAP